MKITYFLIPDVPEHVDLKKLHETYIYMGSKNILNYHREYFMVFDCDYDLHNYPFDAQLCTIDLQLSKFDKKFVRLVPRLTGNRGPDELDQFVVTNIEIVSIEEDSLIQCKIQMKRVPLYFITTTFMPTICIMFMALSTLFIDKSHFKAIIMVALTTMLVMYTLFQSISISLPATAYLKLLDYWLIFGLIMPFFVFTSIIINELKVEHNSNRVTVTSDRRKMYVESDWEFIFWARIILPTITVAFIIIYFMTAIYINFSQ